MEIVKYKEGDEIKILELFELAFKKSLSKSFWDWRFKNNPFGKELMINLMWEDNILAGHYAVSAIEIDINNETIQASLSGTTMTHPNFQGRRIFSDLAISLYDRIHKDQDIALVYGFPNNKSHYGLVKNILWEDLGIISNFSKKINIVKQDNNSNNFKLNLLSDFNHEHEVFIKNKIKELGFNISIKRSEKYLNWRYLKCPINNYYCFEIRENEELQGIVIFKIYENKGSESQIDIMEFICEPDYSTIKNTLDLIVDFLAKEEFSEITLNMWLSLYDARHLLFEKLNFQIGMPLTYMCAKPFSEKYKDITNFKDWYISMGDSDVY
jgi:hypothetical protein